MRQVQQEVERLNDDGVGRALDRLFTADVPSLVLAVATHAVKEFAVSLDELHNDSTTITFCGAYAQATAPQRYLGRPTLAITFGHNKDHRPDRKQLLYILTVTADGGVPLSFRVENGNVTDDQTHRATWELLCQLTGRRDFLYVADSKLATRENMAHLHQRQGRFVTVLPRTRSGRIERTLKQLAALQEKLRSPRSRYRQEVKVAAAVAEILQSGGAAEWIVTEIHPQTEETFHQDHRGRPGKDTRYVKKVARRFDLSYRIDDARVAADARSDGIFPLWSPTSPSSARWICCTLTSGSQRSRSVFRN